MSLKKLIKFSLIYLIAGYSLVFILIFVEFIYHKIPPGVKAYKSFVLDAMSGSPDHLARFKATPDYSKLINTSSLDSVDYYWNKYKHSK